MHTTIYIRKENEQAWRDIEDKSRWINEHLEGEHESATDRHIKRLAREVIDEHMQQYS